MSSSLRKTVSRRNLLAAGGMFGASRLMGSTYWDCAPPREYADPTEGFDTTKLESFQNAVYRVGNGPPVVVLHEAEGLTPADLELARRLAKRHFTAYVPLLFGKAGEDTPLNYARSCLKKEFVCRAQDKTAPMAKTMTALATELHAKTKARIGVIGISMTGFYPLVMMHDDAVVAPVLCAPSAGIDEEDLKFAAGRTVAPILGLRFTADKKCPAAHFERIEKELGARFQKIEIDSSKGNAEHVDPHSHSVLTGSFMDCENHPTAKAFERVVEFLNKQLRS